MAVQYASIQSKTCPMFDPACAAKVAEHISRFRCQPFSSEDAMVLVESACGRYVRGKHKGQLRGWAEIRVCTVGGWWREQSRVLLPGMVILVAVRDYSGKVYIEEGLA